MNASTQSTHLSTPTILSAVEIDKSEVSAQSEWSEQEVDKAKLGSLLLHANKIKLENVEQILGRQRQLHLPFGTWAVNLSLCTQADIEQALVAQTKARRLAIADSGISKKVSCTFASSGPYASAILELRNFLQLNWLGINQQNVLTILSPQQSDGRSILVANLAVTFAQLGLRTLIVDADLRKPTQSKLFANKPNGAGVSELTRGLRLLRETIVNVPAVPNLYLMPSGQVINNPHDIFAREGFASLLNQCRNLYQVILVDTPSFEAGTEASLIARHSGSALLLARNGKTSAEAFNQMSIRVKQNSIHGVGSILIG
jgi:protein-tyrosine kinase